MSWMFVIDGAKMAMEIGRIYDDHYAKCNIKAVHDVFGAVRRRLIRYSELRDIEEVVRCRDCVHRDYLEDENLFWCQNAQYRCNNPLWYCAGGVRKYRYKISHPIIPKKK